MDHTIYLPFHFSVPDKDLNWMMEKTIEAYQQLVKYLQQPHVPRPTDELTR
jgi:hypothetical protein